MKFDVAVIGAGLVGCSVARRVAREGRSVVVVDRSEPATHASWAAAGMLAPQAESEEGGPFLSLLLRAREGFQSLAQELEAETGIGIGHRREGGILAAFDESDEAELERRLEWQTAAQLEVEKLTGDQARRLEPSLSTSARAALRFRGDHQVDNRLLSKAMWFSAAGAGAAFKIGAAVQHIERGNGVRLVTQNGEHIEAEVVVVAAGSWSALIGGLPRRLPVEPVRGQLLSIETGPPPLKHIIGSPRGYLVPRADGRLIVGATVERTGYETAVTVRGLQQLTSIALEIAPKVAELPVATHWSGLRPGTPDGLPILGPDPYAPEIVYATGHYRNGILLGPLTGDIIGSLLSGGSTEVDLAPYAPDRFDA